MKQLSEDFIQISDVLNAGEASESFLPVRRRKTPPKFQELLGCSVLEFRPGQNQGRFPPGERSLCVFSRSRRGPYGRSVSVSQ